MDQHTYRSASNSLLARTADRTSKTSAFQGDPSRSTHTPSSKCSSYIVYPAGRDVTWNDLALSFRIFSPNIDIEKILAPLRSHISSPKSPRWSHSLSPRSGVQTWLLFVISFLPLQNSLPNHKTHIDRKRLSMILTIYQNESGYFNKILMQYCCKIYQ
ncbi:hypothetical protein AVEN_18892-1 [Araneus ventricosus]|uniref:Uncharacterized protein n=1 Tax=Araneus ventricosus TaxID=182803 RepID=A0A4Y2IAB6_ARAVE|nr:hypothetical protein AVEN_18892-1 [Araneus ventricosus]